jgi:hypothetical protein
VNPRHLERLCRRERRQDPGQASGKHRLPGPGRPGEEKVVAPGRGDLERAACPLLAANVGEIEERFFLRRVTVALDVRLGLAFAPQVGGGLCEMAKRHRLDAGKSRLGRGAGGTQDPGQAGPARRLRKSERASNRPQPPVKGELADGGVLGEPVAWDLTGGGEDREGDREVEARALLAEPRRREIHSDPAHRPIELGRDDSAADALLRLLARAIGEADDCERGHGTLEVRLDLDPTGVEPDERMRDRPRQHVPRLGWPSAHVCVKTRTKARIPNLDRRRSGRRSRRPRRLDPDPRQDDAPQRGQPLRRGRLGRVVEEP